MGDLTVHGIPTCVGLSVDSSLCNLMNYDCHIVAVHSLYILLCVEVELNIAVLLLQQEAQAEELRRRLDVETAVKSTIENSTKNLTSLQNKVSFMWGLQCQWLECPLNVRLLGWSLS